MVSPVKAQTNFKPDQAINQKEALNDCDEKIIQIIQKLRSFQGISFETRENAVHIILDQKLMAETQKQEIDQLKAELQKEVNIRNDLLQKVDEMKDMLNETEESRDCLQNCLKITCCIIAAGGAVILFSILPPEMLEIATTTQQVATSILSVAKI